QTVRRPGRSSAAGYAAARRWTSSRCGAGGEPCARRSAGGVLLRPAGARNIARLAVPAGAQLARPYARAAQRIPPEGRRIATWSLYISADDQPRASTPVAPGRCYGGARSLQGRPYHGLVRGRQTYVPTA